MLPLFFRNYDPWVDQYFIYDDGSTDGSIETLKAHPKVEMRRMIKLLKLRISNRTCGLAHKI